MDDKFSMQISSGFESDLVLAKKMNNKISLMLKPPEKSSTAQALIIRSIPEEIIESELETSSEIIDKEETLSYTEVQSSHSSQQPKIVQAPTQRIMQKHFQ